MVKFITTLLLIGLMGASSVHAHLLNMTKATFVINTDGQIEAKLLIDLTREAGSGQGYYDFTTVSSPLNTPDILALTERLGQGVDVTMGDWKANWRIKSIEFPTGTSYEDFVSGLAWPMTTVHLYAQLPAEFKFQSLQFRFTKAFKFEEPIALNVLYEPEERQLNRWLVRNQYSPYFYFDVPEKAVSPNTAELADKWLNDMWLGITHIIPYGWDHALFVLGLFLGFCRVRELIIWVSGFTFAHSLTLGLASYGAITVPANIIEPIIALSIAWLAIENLVLKTHVWWRFLVVCAFGLVHGLGFAAVLKSLNFTDGFIGALISFNVGVEIAQLGILLVAWLLIGRFRYRTWWCNRVMRPGSIVIAMIALYWTFQRIFF